MKTTDLNQNEKMILLCVANSSKVNGGDFTYFDYAMKLCKALFSENQVKGYLSQLEKKKYIVIFEKQISASRKVDFLTDYLTIEL
jgi:hypothetical protein